jgi:hypothetical protein
MFGTQQRLVAAASLVAALAASQAASAQILAENYRVGNYTNTSTTFTAIPLANSGNVTVTFTTTTANELVRITYNVECGVLGPYEAWLAVEITVDGNQAYPNSGTQFALCSSVDPSGADYGWTGAVRQSLYVVPAAGTHKVQVLGAGEDGATGWWQGDSSIVVDH